MAMPIDAEPLPRRAIAAWRPTPVPRERILALPRRIAEPDAAFLSVLRARASTIGGTLSLPLLSSLLWHATSLRERRPDGLYGLPWESRNAPSAGGLHPLSILVIPLDAGGPFGIYEPDDHLLVRGEEDETQTRELNAQSVADLVNAQSGITLQLVADPTKTAACYENPEPLILRDAGALGATLCLVAAALGIASVTLGRAGTDIIRAAGLRSPFIGVGGIHVSGTPK
ncbi:nitroreductase family protein [Sphingopyxis terrae subsp. ummariensis]